MSFDQVDLVYKLSVMVQYFAPTSPFPSSGVLEPDRHLFVR
jgi:hypothetical protein